MGGWGVGCGGCHCVGGGESRGGEGHSNSFDISEYSTCKLIMYIISIQIGWW